MKNAIEDAIQRGWLKEFIDKHSSCKRKSPKEKESMMKTKMKIKTRLKRENMYVILEKHRSKLTGI